MKRVLSMALVIIMLLSVMLTGCGTQGSTPAASTAPAATAKEAVSGSSTDTTVTAQQVVPLKALMLKHALTKDVTTMEWLTKFQQDAGVSITWQQISADWDKKKGTMLASGDLPDIIIGPAFIDSDYSQFPGLFQDMTDLIQKDAPNVQKFFAEKPPAKIIATQLDGKIYSLPRYTRYGTPSITSQFINKTWLDKLGLQVPTNWDELYNVLVAFKTKDPNGNGKADEIPMDWAPGVWGFNALNMLAGNGVYMTGINDGFFVENGTVKNFFVDDRYKQLVEFLNKCQKAGLINPEVFTQDYTKFQSLTRNPDAPAVGFTFGWDTTDRFGTQWASQYVPVAPLKPTADYSGVVTWDYSIDGNYAANRIVMSAKCSDKDAAMKFIDQFYSPVNGMQVEFGSIGPNIKDNGDGSYTVLPPQDSKMDPGTWRWTTALCDNGPRYVPESLQMTPPTDTQAHDALSATYKPYQDKVDGSKDVWPNSFIKFNSADNNQMALLKTNLNKLTNTKWANWVSKGGIDKEWDSYVKDCDKAGLQQILQIMQKYYNDYQKNSK